VSFVNSIFNFLRFNKKNWKAVVLCLLAATVFWFFNALNKTYSANITLPLVFDYDHANYIPVKPLPHHVKMNVTGLGWELFRKSAGLKVSTLSIPLEKPAEVRKIVGSTLPPFFATQLEGLQINFVLTDTLFLEIDENIRRKVSLSIDSVNQYIHPDFGVNSPITIMPDTLWVEGPKRLVVTLPSTINLPLPEKRISNNFREEVEVNFSGSKALKLNPPMVEVAFDVEPYVEITQTIPLQIINVPAKVKPAIDIREVTCVYRLPERLAHAPADSLSAYIDFKNLEQGNKIVAPQILKLPKKAHLLKVDSVRITF
jgi:hypothetical protein